MTKRMIVGALVAALLAVTGAAFAQTPKKDCPQPSASPSATSSAAKAPERIEGEVTRIDKGSGQVTMRLSDGSTQQFTAGKETLDDLKVGDRIEAKKRDC